MLTFKLVLLFLCGDSGNEIPTCGVEEYQANESISTPISGTHECVKLFVIKSKRPSMHDRNH